MVSASTPKCVQRSRNGFWVVRILVFVAFFDLFVQFPIAAPYAVVLGASSTLVGLVVAAYSLANLPGNILAGVFLDRWGRTRLLLIGLVLTAVVVATYSIVRSPDQLVVLRILHGLVVATLAPGAFALAGDLASPGDRMRVMGVNGAVIALAAIIAPALAGIVQEWFGFRWVFLLDAVLLLNAAALLWLFRHRLQPLESQRVATDRVVTRWPLLLRQQAAPYWVILTFAIALGVLVTHVPERLQALGISPVVRGTAFSLYGLVAAAVMISPFSGQVLRQRWLIKAVVGVWLVALGLLVASGFGLSSPLAIERMTLLGASVFGFGFGLLFPAVTAEVARRSSGETRGRAFGLFYALYSLGVVFGAVMSGWLSEIGPVGSGWPFIAGALFGAAGSILPLLERRVHAEVPA